MAAVSSSSSRTITSLRNPKEITIRTTNISIQYPNQHSQRLLFTHGRGSSLLCQPIYAVKSDLDTSVADMKDIGATLRKSKVVIESQDENTIQVRVDLSGKDTQKVFDDVLTNLARTAPAVPGFRKLKGGKTSNVPKDFLIRAIGEARVVKFVIQEIISTSMTEYVEQEKLKMKKEFKTIQSAEELEKLFEPGKPFGFNATMDFDKEESKEEIAPTTTTTTTPEEPGKPMGFNT
ncbi:hypothetical protein ACHQM5_001307 [Ranunculus cassubicifolius]